MARNFQRSGRPTDKAWLKIPSSSLSITSAGTVIAAGVLNFTGPGTILRVRGDILFAFGGVTVALDEMTFAMGLGLVSSDAAALGATAMPDPAAEADYPWLWWKEFSMFSTFAIDGTGTDHSGQLQVRIPVDTKAMRRVKPGQTLVLTGQYVDVVGTPPVRWMVSGFRVLIGT